MRAWPVVLMALLLSSSHAWALTGVVVNARTRVPIANAEVTVVGHRGSARTAADGSFEWPLPASQWIVAIVILPDGRVGRPIHMRTPDDATPVTLAVDATVSEAVQVDGTAPTIDINAGASAALIPALDIAVRHPATLAQALENIPGVGAISEGQSATPAIRGLARGRTTILVDGSRASSERRAGPNGAFLDPGIIDRVEVARGPGSVAYGSDAMGGVIAVRTRAPDYQRTLGVRLAGTLGAFDQARGELELSSGYGAGGVLVGVRFREFGDYESPHGVVPNSGWRDRGLRLRWDHSDGRTRWTVGWQMDRARDIGRPRSDGDIVRVTSPHEDMRRFTVSYERESLFGFRRVRADGQIGSASQQTIQDRLPMPSRTRSVEQADVSWREMRLRVTGDHVAGGARVQVGADLDVRHGLRAIDTATSYSRTGEATATLETVSIENARRANAGAFAQADVVASRHVRLSAGLRTDIVRSVNSGGYFGSRDIVHGAVAGSTAATFVLGDALSLTTQLSRGFRDPMLSDRFYRGPVGRGFVEGNPSLDPETSRQADVLARYAKGRFSFSAAGYHYRISSLIERYEAEPGVIRHRNRGAANLRGVELETSADLAGGFSTSVTAQASRGRDAGDDTPIDDVSPRSVSILGRHTLPAVSSYLRVSLVAAHRAPGPSEVATPGYVLVDAGAAWRIGRRLQIVVSGRNLLNAAYHANPGPRWVYAPGAHGSLSLVVAF